MLVSFQSWCGSFLLSADIYILSSRLPLEFKREIGDRLASVSLSGCNRTEAISDLRKGNRIKISFD